MRGGDTEGELITPCRCAASRGKPTPTSGLRVSCGQPERLSTARLPRASSHSRPDTCACCPQKRQVLLVILSAHRRTTTAVAGDGRKKELFFPGVGLCLVPEPRTCCAPCSSVQIGVVLLTLVTCGNSRYCWSVHKSSWTGVTPRGRHGRLYADDLWAPARFPQPHNPAVHRHQGGTARACSRPFAAPVGALGGPALRSRDLTAAAARPRCFRRCCSTAEMASTSRYGGGLGAGGPREERERLQRRSRPGTRRRWPRRPRCRLGTDRRPSPPLPGPGAAVLARLSRCTAHRPLWSPVGAVPGRRVAGPQGARACSCGPGGPRLSGP